MLATTSVKVSIALDPYINTNFLLGFPTQNRFAVKILSVIYSVKNIDELVLHLLEMKVPTKKKWATITFGLN